MHNLAMKHLLDTREAIDVSSRPRIGDYYVLDSFVEDVDYCDAKREIWIRSIGEHKSTGQILASPHDDLYQDPDYLCLYLSG